MVIDEEKYNLVMKMIAKYINSIMIDKSKPISYDDSSVKSLRASDYDELKQRVIRRMNNFLNLGLNLTSNSLFILSFSYNKYKSSNDLILFLLIYYYSNFILYICINFIFYFKLPF